MASSSLQLFFFFEFSIADPATLAANQAGKEEVDARSVFVGNVRMLMFLLIDFCFLFVLL